MLVLLFHHMWLRLATAPPISVAMMSLRSRHVPRVGDPQHFACLSVSKAVFSKVEAQIHDCDSWHHEGTLLNSKWAKSKEVITSWTFGASETSQGWGVPYLINYIVSHFCHLVLTYDQRVYVIHFKKNDKLSLWPMFSLNYPLTNARGQ